MILSRIFTWGWTFSPLALKEKVTICGWCNVKVSKAKGRVNCKDTVFKWNCAETYHIMQLFISGKKNSRFWVGLNISYKNWWSESSI